MDSRQAVTKIILPGKRNNLLHRTRLTNFLHENIERKLLLVSASAGYGKTSLLIDFSHETALPVCWYSLDASDSDPKIFLEYVVASLRRQFPGFGSRTLGLLPDSALVHDVEVIVSALVTEIFESIPSYFVLILDDYQTVEESEPINHILDSLLRLLPENAHIILASRTLPSKLTLTRLTARQEIAGLGVNDLRFTADEIRSLVQQNYRVDLSEQQAAELAEASEGWITAILLTRHSLWQGLFKDLIRSQGPSGQVFNYLASEVFAQQPLDLQRFLLDSSILDQLSPPICDELLGIQDSADMLRAVEQRNLFVVHLDEDDDGTTFDAPRTSRGAEDVPSWYRYHHLFQEFLQARLREAEGARWQTLHHQAAAVYQARGAWDQAIAHYVKAEEFQAAAQVIEQIAKETFDIGHWVTLAKWIDALPGEILDVHPHLIVWRAMVYSNTGDLNRALELYSHGLAVFEKAGDRNGTGKTLVQQAIALRFQGQYQRAIENCDRALKILGEDRKREIAEAHRTLGISYGLIGNLAKDIEELQAALVLYESLNDYSHVALLQHDLGVAHRTAGTADAQRHFQQALEYWHRANNPIGLANTLNSIGVGYHRQGAYAQALETLNDACAEARRSGQLRIEAFALASVGDVYRDNGEYEKAQEVYQAAFAIARQINEGFGLTYLLTALGATFRLIGDFQAADELLRQALEQAASHHSNYELGLAKTELGILNCEQGDRKVAEDCLSDAITLLEQGGAKRDSARAHLNLANVLLGQRKYRQVNLHLKATAAIGEQLHEDQFVVADAKQLTPLLKYAVSKKIGNSYFMNALEKIATSPVTPANAEAAELAEIRGARLEARAFGSATVFVNGKLVTKTDWDSAASKELFFFLLAHPLGLRKELILSTLWADVSPAKANGIFHSTAWRMRRALIPDCLVYENGLYRINPEIDLNYDVLQFKQLVEQAEHAQAEELGAEYRQQAIALYQGDYLEDLYGDWCNSIRADLQRQYLAALLSLAQFHARRTETNKAMALCRKILDKDNYREDVYRELMRLQVKAGNAAAALKTYQRCIEVLEEAQLNPSPETQALAERIMRGEQL